MAITGHHSPVEPVTPAKVVPPGMVEVKCQCCKQPFMARVADRKRGWGKFCSKRCKAVKQEARTGQYANHIYGKRRRSEEDEGGEICRPLSQEEMADHGQWTD